MTNFSHTLPTIFNATAPVFLLVLLGIALVRLRLIDRPFIDSSSRLVFLVAMPVMLFLATAQVDFTGDFDPRPAYYLVLATTLSFFLLFAVSRLFIRRGEDLGAFVQGAYRSNFAIIGLALIINLYGAKGLEQASILMAVTIPLYNLLAVFCLSYSLSSNLSPYRFLRAIITNPLVLGIVLGLPFAALQLPIPNLLKLTGNYLADIAMPLALLGIGGTLNLAMLRQTSTLAIISTLLRLVVVPAVLTLIAWLMGIQGMPLVLLFIVFGCPTALASFIMAKSMGANAELAGSIILLTTLLSPLTLGGGLLLLHYFGLAG